MERFNLEGVSAIVTGGASGIGLACAEQLSALGAKVVIADLNEEGGKEVATRLGGFFAKCDVTKEEDVQGAIAAAVDMGPLKVLINSAGVGFPGRTIDRENNPLPQDHFDLVVGINLNGTFNMLRHAASAMAKNEPNEDAQRGVIINMASVAAFDGQIGQAAYSASKGAVVGMTLPIARDLSVVGIRVNTVAPGLIDTPIYGEGEASEAFKANLGQNVLFPKRLGVPHELASMVIECVTNPYMNAEVIRVDGGIRMPPK